MKTLLANNTGILVTMDGERRELKNTSFYAEDRIVKQIGPLSALPPTADTVLDLTGQIRMPAPRRSLIP